MFSKQLKYIILLLLCTESMFSYSQDLNKYWVFYKDKHNTTFNPYEYFDTKAIERRLNNHISLTDSTDFPVNENYITLVKSIADTITQTSRWFNASAVIATKKQLQKIIVLPCVKSIEPINSIPEFASSKYDTILDSNSLKLLFNQTASLKIEEFKKLGIDGKNMRIAILDGGFPGVNTSPAFEHIRNQNHILKTWDFVRNSEDVYHAITHGTMVLSCIAGIINGKPIGLAPQAEFLLARTEMRYEPYSEEENWLAAAEWADKNGAQIINSSLGYTFHRYFNNQMNGKTSMVARAATMAARKGILVINAAGNEGLSKWHWIATPADADSIITVGGIDPTTNLHVDFSSYGPSIDKRIKPNVSAYGHVIAASNKGIYKTQGTSFAAPLVTGFAACVWELNPNYSNMQLLTEIERSGTLYPYFDYAHGYGIPQASYFTDKTKNNTDTTFDISIDSLTRLTVTLRPNIVLSNEISHQDYLFYNNQKPNNVVEKYVVINMQNKRIFYKYINDLKPGDRINIHVKGYTATYTVPDNKTPN